MLTVALKVENGGRGEDRVHVEQCGSRTLAVVADGAGGTGAARPPRRWRARSRQKDFELGVSELRRIGRGAFDVPPILSSVSV
jgi:hypothetical protein